MSIARLLGLSQYRSDTTDFINDLKKSRPELEDQQRAGRALLWDRPIDRGLQDEFKEGRVPQKPYVYHSGT